MKWTKWKVFRTIWVMAGIGFFIWTGFSYKAWNIDPATFQSNASVHVERTKDFISFTPVKDYQKVFIFYPGALVDPDAYGPLCRKIADSGYKALIIKMPWRLAVYGYDKIKKMDWFGDTARQYILAGHSQGGRMAAQFVSENPLRIDRLILIGTTHPRDIDLSGSAIPVLKIYGSNDGIAEMKEVNAHKNKLPPATKYVLIKGANHSQFGCYGYQLGDKKAGITKQEQQQIILDAILAFIRQS